MGLTPKNIVVIPICIENARNKTSLKINMYQDPLFWISRSSLAAFSLNSSICASSNTCRRMRGRGYSVQQLRYVPGGKMRRRTNVIQRELGQPADGPGETSRLQFDKAGK